MTGLLIPVRYLVPPEGRINFLVPAVAAAAGFAYFLYSQHLQETKFFADLFKQFNERYAELNGPLNMILKGALKADLTEAEHQTLDDYFNLCAEEFLYHEAGFIDKRAWEAWRNGMRVFAQNQRIKQRWEQELSAESHYGFSLKVLAK